MAIQGIFLADFTQYNAAVDGADAKLRKFTSTTDKHDAASKRFSSTTTQTSNSFGQLSQGLSTADKTLSAFGVHIGPEIHALEELSQASGKTASQIGLIGTVSLTAAAALGGWEIGRTVAKFFDLDKSIANATASLLGWGDVAAETARAKQDVINRAITNGAEATISYTDAVKFNTAAIEANNAKTKAGAEAVAAYKKAKEDAQKAADQEAEAVRRLQKAHEDAVAGLADKLFGADDIELATNYVEALGRVENVVNLDSAALQTLFDALTAGISGMVQQGLAADDLTNQMEQFRVAVVQAQQSHTASIVQMETDEERFKRENDELAQAMKDNFVIIGHSAEEAAGKMDEFGDAAEEAGQRAADAADAYQMSWSDAMDAVRAGQGTMGGVLSGTIPVGAEGSTTRYDDYGNPYGYIPGVNLPGHTAPPTGGSGGSFVFNISDSFFETPADHQRLADRVRTALGTQAMSRGA